MKNAQTQKKVLAFGTFDGIHAGHIHFLKEASKLGELFISVATDESILARKQRLPERKTLARVNDVKELKITKNVASGDRILNKWSEIKKIKPNIIALGYDQKELGDALKKDYKNIGLNFIIKKMSPFKPQKLHSSIIHKSCAFCTIPEIKQRTVLENKYAWAFPTNIPIVPGHILISPKRCLATFEELNKFEKEAIFLLIIKLKKILKKIFKAEGFHVAWNEGEVANQSVPHFHAHLLPRRKGDSGITKYDPRKFLYRPGSREKTPEKELLAVSKLIKNNLK